MPTHLGPLRVEVIAPESEKFTAPLLLVHGLWTAPTAWRRFAGFLAHRGWRCHAVESVGDDPRERAGALRAAIAALEAPPVIVGHDLGGWLTLQCADAARAVVALAPLPDPRHGAVAEALAGAGSWWARRRGAALHAPRGRWQASYPDPTRTESATLVQALLTRALSDVTVPASVPAAVMVGAEDPLVDPAGAAAFAGRIGAESVVLPATGHAILNEPGWEDRVAAVHRWLIQRLGVELLALYDEAWEGRESERDS